jgi:hypothetical protein
MRLGAIADDFTSAWFRRLGRVTGPEESNRWLTDAR